MATDEYKLLRDQDRAARASQLLENEILNEAFKTLESAYIEAWKQTKYDDQIGREKLFLATNVIGIVRDHLASIVANGKLASAELKMLAAKRELEQTRKRRSNPQ